MAALRARGADLLPLPGATDGRLDLAALAAELGRRGVMSLLVEGGATVHGAFLAAGLVDRVTVYVAPLLIGGVDAPGPVGGVGVSELSEAIRPAALCVERLGADVKLTADLTVAEWPN